VVAPPLPLRMDPCVPRCGLSLHSDAESTAALSSPLEGVSRRPPTGAIVAQSPKQLSPILLSELRPPPAPPPTLRLPYTVPPPPPLGAPLGFQLALTVAALGTLALLIGIVRWLAGAAGRRALALAAAAGPSDGSWILVSFEWTPGGDAAPGRMPIMGMGSTGDLLTALLEYGAEEVDPSISAHTAEVRYVDELGIERRLGAKTRFETVRRAKLIIVRPLSESERQRLLGSVIRREGGMHAPRCVCVDAKGRRGAGKHEISMATATGDKALPEAEELVHRGRDPGSAPQGGALAVEEEV